MVPSSLPSFLLAFLSSFLHSFLLIELTAYHVLGTMQGQEEGTGNTKSLL